MLFKAAIIIKAATGGVLQKKLFVKISQYSEENTELEYLF